MTGSLTGRRIAVPETRELDRLAGMLEQQGATTLRCPLVSIHDAPDPAPVLAWLRRFADAPFDDLILLTGEGLRRLDGFARREELEPAFLAALAATRKVTRGPKPAQALRELGLKPDLRAEQPTTDGVIAAPSGDDLRGHRVGVQLYPDNPNAKLTEFLTGAGAVPDAVLPYVYASAADDEKVVALIDDMAAGKVDVIAFTSSPQVRRLFAVAEAAGREAALRAALHSIVIAAVGPVVAEELQRRGVAATVTPSDAYFMKPLVSVIVAACGGGAA